MSTAQHTSGGPGVISGPSGGVLGNTGGAVSLDVLQKHPGIARQIVTIGRYPRAGHDRARWETVRWHDYRAQVGIGGRSGPWHIWAHEVRDGDDGDPGNLVTAWITEAEQLPAVPPGVYTELLHDQRGLVMSDVPAEICGALPFLDYVADDLYQPPEAPHYARPRVLIAGLGLGIVPAWLLTYTDVARVDVVEIDPDVISLVAGDPYAREHWAADRRLHIYLGDACTWWPGHSPCLLHSPGWACCQPGDRYDAAWFDIWDTVSPHNLPSMQRLTRRFARRCGRIWSWERPECEAMLARGQTLERPCWVDETGYPSEVTT